MENICRKCWVLLAAQNKTTVKWERRLNSELKDEWEREKRETQSLRVVRFDRFNSVLKENMQLDFITLF